jgi:putative transposase
MDWPHAPIHRFGEGGHYFITAGTNQKEPIFGGPEALDSLQSLLFENAHKHNCWLQSWSLFSNHYHLVISCDEGERLRRMIARLHTESAIEINRRDGAKGRKVWFQFWDTQLTHPGSWLARLRNTHENAVHHGLVQTAAQYKWCSAAWFLSRAPRSFVETVRGVQIDRVNVYDDFSPAASLPG